MLTIGDGNAEDTLGGIVGRQLEAVRAIVQSVDVNS